MAEWKTYHNRYTPDEKVRAFDISLINDSSIKHWLQDIVYHFKDIYDLEAQVSVSFYFEDGLSSVNDNDIIIEYSTGARIRTTKGFFNHFYEEVKEITEQDKLEGKIK